MKKIIYVLLPLTCLIALFYFRGPLFRTIHALKNKRTLKNVLNIGDKITLKKEYYPTFKKKKILIDPGHGCEDSGKVGFGGKKESDIMWDFALIIQKHLNSTKRYNAVLTRTQKDKKCNSGKRIRRRGRMASKIGADAFISLHADAGIRSGTWIIWSSRNQTEENEWLCLSIGAALKEQGLPLFHMMKFYDSSKDVKGYLTTNSHYGCHLDGRGLGVLRASKKPAILIETHFIANPLEVQRFQNEESYMQYAKAIEIGLISYFARKDGVYDPLNQSKTAKAVVQIAAFETEKEAKNLLRTMKSKGFSGYQEGYQRGEQTWYRVRIGPFEKDDNVNQTIAKLKKEGFEDYWLTSQ